MIRKATFPDTGEVEVVTLAYHTEEMTRLTRQVTRLLEMYQALEGELARADATMQSTLPQLQRCVEEHDRVLLPLRSIGAQTPVGSSPDKNYSALVLEAIESNERRRVENAQVFATKQSVDLSHTPPSESHLTPD